MSNEIVVRPSIHVPFEDMERMAGAIARSGLFGMKNADQALALMAIAAAEGLHPGIVARDYHVIQGRPALKSDAMLARFQTAGGSVKWLSHTDEKVEAIFSHPQGGSLTIDWTMARATAAKLTDKDNWKTYPRQMLRARVISEGVRAVWPGVSVGVYTPEEVQDMAPDSIEGHYEFVQGEVADPRGAQFANEPIATDPQAAAEQKQEPIPGARYHSKTQERLASEAQLELIRKKAQEKGITRDQLYHQLKINTSLTEELLFVEVTPLLQWLERQEVLDDSHKF